MNKVDLLPHVDFDVARCLEFARRANPNLDVLPVSASHGDGLDGLYEWIQGRSALARRSAERAERVS